MSSLQNATLLFLIRKSEGNITDICLAMKKRGFGEGFWNGVGGKVKENKETIEEAALRETHEEIGVHAQDIQKAAKLSFFFSQNPEWNQKVHVFLSESWIGQPKESEEMKPKWFPVQKIPFKKMWPDDPFWLPLILSGKKVQASFTFGSDNEILQKKVTVHQ